MVAQSPQEAVAIPAIPAFSGGLLDRQAHRRGKDDEASTGMAHVRLWSGTMAMRVEGGLYLDPAGLTDGMDPIFLGDAPGIGHCYAADLGAAPADATPPVLPEGAVWEDLRFAAAALSPVEAELAATARALTHWHRIHRFCAACGAASVPALSGWRRDCTACGAEHFPRTDPVVIMLITHGDRLLLGRNAAWPEGMFSTLAGFMEPGETIEAAVRREVAEESGIFVGEVRYLASQPWPFPASLMIGCHGRAHSSEISIDPTELEAALWVTRQEMLDVYAGLHPRLKPLRKGSIAEAMIRNWLADALG